MGVNRTKYIEKILKITKEETDRFFCQAFLFVKKSGERFN